MYKAAVSFMTQRRFVPGPADFSPKILPWHSGLCLHLLTIDQSSIRSEQADKPLNSENPQWLQEDLVNSKPRLSLNPRITSQTGRPPTQQIHCLHE